MTETAQSKAVIYTRGASVGPASDDLHAKQEALCRAYAHACGYQVEAVFRDDASGSASDRTGFKAMLAYLAGRDEKPVVLVDDVSRLARSVSVMNEVRDAIRATGAMLLSSSVGSPSAVDPNDDRQEAMLIAIAQGLKKRAEADELEVGDAAT